MIPGDAEYSRKDIKNGDRHVCAVPLFMAERGNDGPETSKKLGVLTLKGRSLMVQETRQTGAPAIQKAALLVACGARLLSRIVDARFDPLTGLPKKPEYEAQLSKLVAEYVAGGPNFSLLMFDLDHFKRVNDTYGHDAGDLALRAVAAALSTSLRSIRKGDVQERRSNGHNADMDQCFRWGGEELTVILPKTDVSEALIIAERLRTVIEGVKVDTSAGEVGLSMSVGVSDADAIIGRKEHHDTDIENLAHKLTHDVDFALYAAKDGGRNKVAYPVGSPDGPRRYLLFSQAARGN
ncbi:MAG: GGDEF domain-containing protein [Candidatus Micrarchaeota archaeon]